MKSALILGTGISGKAAIKLLLKNRYKVYVSCKDADADQDFIRTEFPEAEMLCGDHACNVDTYQSLPYESKLVVVSPGIPLSAEEITRYTEYRMLVAGELAVGAAFFKNRIIAVTGTKGKSSVVKLISGILNAAGIFAVPCGNYGRALCDVAAMDDQPDIAVVECSSFQLETITPQFKPDAAVILNFSQDHLNRHVTMENYLNAKISMFRYVDDSALCLIPYPDEKSSSIYCAFSEQYKQKPVTFGINEKSGWIYKDGTVICNKEKLSINIKNSYFDNSILGKNAAAACAMLVNEKVPVEIIESGFKQFEPLPYRMQLVGQLNGVRFVNDSKATNISALYAGVSMAGHHVYLIAGGQLKERIEISGNELTALGVKKAYLIGECMYEMKSLWFPDLPVDCCGNLEDAVIHAFKDASLCGGTVLLSPGTASFDQFKDYADRGEQFTNVVRKILSGKIKLNII